MMVDKKKLIELLALWSEDAPKGFDALVNFKEDTAIDQEIKQEQEHEK